MTAELQMTWLALQTGGTVNALSHPRWSSVAAVFPEGDQWIVAHPPTGVPFLAGFDSREAAVDAIDKALADVPGAIVGLSSESAEEIRSNQDALRFMGRLKWHRGTAKDRAPRDPSKYKGMEPGQIRWADMFNEERVEAKPGLKAGEITMGQIFAALESP
jgi:hypothetical protein